MSTLIVICANLRVREFTLTDVATIGRHETNTIQVFEENASRFHCRILSEAGRFRLEDLNSRNGVYVNGAKVSSHVLKHNDRIAIGGTSLVFSAGDSYEKNSDTRDLVEAITGSFAALKEHELLEDQPFEPYEEEEKESRATPVRAARRVRRVRASNAGSYALTAALIAAGAAGVLLLWNEANRKSAEDRERAAREAAEARKHASDGADAPRRVAAAPAPASAPAQPAHAAGISIAERFASALEARDRGLAADNLTGAKAALQTFLNALPEDQRESETAQKARRELDETTRVANAAFELSLKQAKDALEAKHFHLVFLRCTSLISNDPGGTYGAQAREILEHIDESTAPLAADARSKALDAIKQGRLDEARSALQGVLGELSGTRWAAGIGAMDFSLHVATDFLQEVDAAAKKAAGSDAAPIHIKSKKIDGILVGMNGFSVVVASGAAQVGLGMAAVEPTEFTRALQGLGLAQRHTELGCLWLLLDRKDAARASADAALRNPGKSLQVAALAGLLADSANLHLYDFSGWRQQTDWEAVTGSWLTQDEKYVLESSDGGETFLKPGSIGGPFPLAGANAGFEFDIRKPSPGWFFLCEFGSEKQGVVVYVSANAIELQDKIGPKAPAVKWNGAETRAELVLDGDTASLLLNGEPAAKLSIAGLSQVSGTLRFQAHQCTCTIDNVVLRSIGGAKNP